MRVKVIGCWLLVIGCLALTSCQSDIVYSHFCPISYPDGTITSSEKWHVDSVVQFDYPIADTTASYQMLVYVQHTERYPYQNMWMFIDNAGRRDTIEFYLADDRGKWLGDKHHGFIEMPVLFEENYHFADTGIYHLSVQHAMRDTLLRGVTDIGLEIHQN